MPTTVNAVGHNSYETYARVCIHSGIMNIASISIGVFQEEDAKLCVFGADLLGNIDPSLLPSELHQLNHGQIPNYK